jgi:hypothetical protein
MKKNAPNEKGRKGRIIDQLKRMKRFSNFMKHLKMSLTTDLDRSHRCRREGVRLENDGDALKFRRNRSRSCDNH